MYCVQTNFLRGAVTRALGEISQERGKEEAGYGRMDGRTRGRVSKSRHQLFAAGRPLYSTSSQASGQASTPAHVDEGTADDHIYRVTHHVVPKLYSGPM